MVENNKSTKLMSPKAFLSVFILLAFAADAFGATVLSNRCADLLSGRDVRISREVERPRLAKSSQSGVSERELFAHVSSKIILVPEFQYIRETAQKMGLRVWLFGGTASSFLHYVKWDLARTKGLMDLQKDRFDFDFTNIFRTTQDLDIVVDATVDVARQFQNTIAQRFPHFLGSKANKWEVRTLRHRMGTPGQLGFKEALLNDADFNNQNTDSNSVGMVEVTLSKEPVVRDLRHWDQTGSVFLEDTLNNRISYFRSDRHFTTSRAKAGENPEILSVLRLLVKAFQYELNFSDSEFRQMKEIVSGFNPENVTNSAALRRMQDTAKKLVIHAVNIEYAINKLDELGLRKKLIAMGNKSEQGNFAWWLNREPLRSRPVGEGRGKTARELSIQVVAHETNSFLAYESITRAHSGEPNVLISRQNAVGEAAAYGDGFYTRLGKVGARGTGLTIRFTVDPLAREGTDFTSNGEYIVFKNKKALKIIQESLNFGLDDLMRLAETNQEVQVDKSDLGLLEKLKRRLNAARITDELERLLNSRSESDHNRLVQILSAFQNSSVSKLISEDVMASVVKNIYGRVAQMAQSSKESDILKYVKTVGPILKTVDTVGLLKNRDFIQYLERLSSGRGSFDLRKEAVFEILLNAENFENSLNFKRDLSQAELRVVTTEIREWHKSPDARKRKFAVELNKKWSEAIEKGEVKRLEALVDSSFFEINHKNVSEVSMLQLAGYYKQNKVIEWLVSNPEFDFNAKNARGFTEVEQLLLSGKTELAAAIARARPEVQVRRFQVKERNVNEKTKEYPEGTPIVDFVRIEPSSFMMGDGATKVLTSVSKPFEFMSVDVTQETYRVVVELLKQNLRSGEYNVLEASPSNFKAENHPVEQVSHDDVSLWKKGLNELSKLDDSQVQQTLSALFPGHKRGKQYSRPTEAQWELVSRLGGVAESDYAHGKGETGLGDHAVYSSNSGSKTQPVGLKRPVFYNGKPIYDLHGNVWKWLEDWYDGSLAGGTDPMGPASGSYRVLRGGSWYSGASSLRSGNRYYWWPGNRGGDVGFRLVRTAE